MIFDLYSGVIVTQLLRDRFTIIDRPQAEWRIMQFLNETAPLAALHITRHPWLYWDFDPQPKLVLILPTLEGGSRLS